MSLSDSTPTPDPTPSSAQTQVSNVQSGASAQGNNATGPKGNNSNFNKRIHFKGLTKEFGEFIYACSHEDPDNKFDIRKTTEAVMLHVATKVSGASEVLCVFDLEQPDLHVSEAFLYMSEMKEGEKILHQEKIK